MSYLQYLKCLLVSLMIEELYKCEVITVCAYFCRRCLSFVLNLKQVNITAGKCFGHILKHNIIVLHMESFIDFVVWF